MQSEDKQFDLMVKAMMTQAQEEVPSGVWEAVSSSLPGRRVIPLWHRVAAGFAAAAAVAAVAVLLSRNNSTFNHIPDVPAAVAVVPSEDRAESAPDGEPLLAFAEPAGPSSPARPSASYVPSAISSPSSQALPASSQEEASVALNEEASPASGDAASSAGEAKEEAGPSAPPSVSSRVSGAGYEGDAFALMEQEDGKQSPRRVSVQAGGSFLTNGDPSSTAGLVRRYAPGIQPSKTTITQTGADSRYSIPLSLGLGLRYHVSDRLFLSSGVEWSMLERSFDGVFVDVKDGAVRREAGGEIHNTLHYVGIPLNLGYDLLRGERMSFYAYAGALMEKGLSSSYRLSTSSGTLRHSESIKGLQWSVVAGIGLEVRLGGGLGLYLDPSLRYYFDCNQPTSIRTQQPLTMGLEAGLRFGF